MKILNPIKLLLVLTMLAVGFSSCEEDDETIYDYLIGRTWVGSLGFAVGPYDVESGVTFKGNEYAIDEQYYYGDGGRAATLNLRWWIDMGTLYLIMVRIILCWKSEECISPDVSFMVSFMQMEIMSSASRWKQTKVIIYSLDSMLISNY